VVRKVRGLLKVKKAGHTGTLDPMATGVLPICVGDATKIAGFITEGDKAYAAVIRLGAETDTQDAEGKIVSEKPVPHLTRDLLEAALANFRGTQMQLPPMYSAVKIAGKRLYELARAGVESDDVPREPRQVTVHELKLLDFSERELTIQVRCSKGFFVRTLAFDFGRALGCGAHLKALRRTHSGPFTLAQAIGLEKVEQLSGTPELASRLVSMTEALSELPALQVPAALAEKVLHGVPIEASAASAGHAHGKVRVMDSSGRLLAVAEVAGDGRLRYLRVLA
jgi:tRNA pseudouridine55 synthase